MKKLVNAFFGWFRVVLPVHLAGGLFAFVVLFAMLFAFRHLVYDSEFLASWSIGIGQAVPVLGVGAYAVFRVWYFHPLENVAYGSWLSTTPWKYPQKLPLGPLYFKLQDVVIVALLVAVASAESMGSEAGWLGVAFVGTMMLMEFIAIHAITVWISAASRREPIGGYGLPALFALALQLVAWPISIFVVAVAMAVVSHISLRQILKNYDRHEPGSCLGSPTKWLLREANLLWPAGRLIVQETGRLIPPLHAVMLAASVAWMVVGVVSCDAYFRQLGGEIGHPIMTQSIAVIFPIFFLAVLRLPVYCGVYNSPISFFGRLFTGRVLIASYDRVFVPTILSLLVAFYLPGLLASLGCPNLLTIGVSIFVAAWILFGMGPTLDDWKHTGHHRIYARRSNKKKFASTA